MSAAFDLLLFFSNFSIFPSTSLIKLALQLLHFAQLFTVIYSSINRVTRLTFVFVELHVEFILERFSHLLSFNLDLLVLALKRLFFLLLLLLSLGYLFTHGGLFLFSRLDVLDTFHVLLHHVEAFLKAVVVFGQSSIFLPNFLQILFKTVFLL